MKKMSIFIAAMVLLAISVNTSCTKEDGLIDSPAEEQVLEIVNTEKVSVKNGILVFQSRNDLYDYLNEVTDNEKLKQKENKLGFNSLFSVCLPASIEDGKLWESYKDLDYTEGEFLEAIENGTLPKYSDVTFDLIKQGKMKIEKIDNDEVLAYATAAPYLVKVLNENKLVCVNDSIFQYNEHEIKFIPNGNFDLIKELDNTTSADDYEGIIVAKERKEKDYYYPTNYISCDWDEVTIEKKRLKGGLRIKHFDFISDVGNKPWYYASYYIEMYTMNYYLWGWHYSIADVNLYSCNWIRDYTWMGSDGYDIHGFNNIQVTANRSSGTTYLLYEGWSDPATMYNMSFMGSVGAQRYDDGRALFTLSHTSVEVPSKWW